jgi:hypothetical protein
MGILFFGAVVQDVFAIWSFGHLLVVLVFGKEERIGEIHARNVVPVGQPVRVVSQELECLEIPIENIRISMGVQGMAPDDDL